MLEVEGLRYCHDGQGTTSYEYELEVGAGEIACLTGKSGSGKSTCLDLIAGFLKPDGGKVRVNGSDILGVAPQDRPLTILFQKDNLFEHLTAAQQLGRIAHPGSRGDDTVGEWLEALGLAPRRDHRPDAMSGGERQRLAFARAAVAGHQLVIADEPTSQLDAASTAQVMEAIATLAERGITVLLATHDRRVLEDVDEVITLRDGAVATVTAGGSSLAVIDRSGRVQLPPELRDRYPERRVRLVWDESSDRVELERP